LKNNADWQQQAIALNTTGTMSWRDIAKMLGKSKSTVSDYLRKYAGFLSTPDLITLGKPCADGQLIGQGSGKNTMNSYETTLKCKNYDESVKNSVKSVEEDNSRILWISDLHAPFHHKNSLKFLADLHKEYKFTRIICAGDEVDFQALNMHGVNPDLPSAGQELKMSKEFLSKLAKLFPVMTILESNHTSLAYRRAFKAGIGKHFMKGYSELFEAPKGWNWVNDLLIELPNKQSLYMTHGKSADGLKLSKNMASNVIQGHFHSKFAIQYWSNPNNLFWSMQAGCLVDDTSLTMAYNKLTLDRPIIGVGIVIDSVPILKPMIL
jgi:predicted MPP superfamily phosphohydrolase